jgi:exodeoxyribonuclease-3
LKLYSWNVNGIRAALKKGALQEMIAAHDPDVLCLQETKASPAQVKLDLPDYAAYWNAADKGGYSGTAIFTKREPQHVLVGLPLDLVQQYDFANDPFGDPTTEGRVIAIELDDCWVVSVYTPNSKRELSRLELRYERWDPAFLSYIKQLESGMFGSGTPKPVIFCGDLNVAHQEIDLARPKDNRQTHGFTDQERERFGDYLANGFIDSFRYLHPDVTGAYTWWNLVSRSRERNVGWRIDYVVMSEALAPRLRDASIHPDVLGSDHCPISIDLAD